MNDSSKGNASRIPWLTIERVGAITDGVIAIVITLLVLEIDVPESHDFGDGGFTSLLYRVSRDVVVYLLSFCLIGVFWLQHHVIFHYVARVDRTFVFFQGMFLFLLSLSPFTTKLAGAYRGFWPAEIAFGVNFLLSGVSLLVSWQYIVRKPYLLRKPVAPAVVRSMSRRILIAPALILAGIGVSMINFHLGALVYFSIPLFYLRHWLIDTSWQSQE
jgi:uncharacterized membrane protein